MSVRRFRDVALAAFVGITAVQLAGCGMGHCIAEGTLVSTPEGVRPIESLRAGDRVLSLDFHGQHAMSTVTSTRTATVTHAFEISLPTGQTLVATAMHPIMTQAGWVKTGSLSPDELITTESGRARVVSIRPVIKPLQVFDLTVSPHENFFANGVLVHNKTVRERPRRDDFGGEWIMRGAFDVWYIFTFHADGTGTAESVSRDSLAPDHAYVRKPLEFILWSVNDYDVELRVRRWSGELLVMKGSASHHGLTMSKSFTLDGMLVERPERLLKQLNALGITPLSPSHPASGAQPAAPGPPAP